MFLDNKYTRWHFAIVDRTKALSHSGYVEQHHMIPKSLGGSDDLENLVFLQSREHLIRYLLLVKMTTSTDLFKMRRALRYMMCVPKKMLGICWIPTNRTVQVVRASALGGAT